ncbi:MAG: hypothetical protein U9Q00_08485 [Synergistota bacterium]|nr:hypothetical protein [Synergistota bacterium]
MTLANIQYSDQFLVMNGDLFDSLSEEDRRVVVEAGKEANRISRMEVEAADSKQVQYLKEKGMEVYSPDENEMDQFREKGQPEYIKWLKTKASQEWLDLAVQCATRANEASKE